MYDGVRLKTWATSTSRSKIVPKEATQVRFFCVTPVQDGRLGSATDAAKGLERTVLSKELEYTLNIAFKQAREKRHEFMTVEHLLLALLDNAAAAKVLRACGADIDKLREDLSKYLDDNTPMLSPRDDRETQPTLGFQRVLQRSVFHVQSSGKKEVTGANVLVAIFGERESQAVYFLQKQNVTRLDVVNYISHGISKVHDASEDAETLGSTADEDKVAEGNQKSPLEA